MGITFVTIGIAAGFVSIWTNFDPASGPRRLLIAFEVIVMGGLGSLWGSLAGGNMRCKGCHRAFQRAMVSFRFFLCLFAGHVGGLFVGAQPEEDRVAHVVTRPLSEFYLPHELGNKPRGGVLGLHFLVERLLVGAQRLNDFIDRLQRRLVEAGADMPSIDPAFLGFVADRKH